MWAEKLGDETFVTIVRPYVLHHRVGIARSSDIREPHPVLGCRVHADAADVLHDAKAKRIRIETAILAGIEHGLMRHIGMGLQELHEGAIGDLPLLIQLRHDEVMTIGRAPFVPHLGLHLGIKILRDQARSEEKTYELKSLKRI